MKKKSNSENFWNTKNPLALIEKKLDIVLDSWQRDYVNAKGNTAVRAGRQSGKSFAQSIRTALFAILHKGDNVTVIDDMDTILITGGVERQAYELYMKIRRIIEFVAPRMIKGRPTMEKMELTNKLRILALPGGRDGAGLRNFNVVRLVVDEAHYVHDDVYNAIEPMLATKGGDMDLLSTPKGNQGKFYEAFQKGSGFSTFHTTSEECVRIPKAFLAMKKKQLTKLQYAQEYLAIFQDALQSFFTRDLVDPLMKLDPKGPVEGKTYVEGQDVAGWGVDDGAYITMEALENKTMEMRDILVTEQTSTRTTIKIMRERERKWGHKKWIMDSGAGGGGGAIFDLLIDDRQFRRKLMGINNASKTVDYKSGRTKMIIKEDLYNNAKRMMEAGEVLLLKDNRLRESLLSIQFEWTTSGNFRIFGSNSHLTEAFIRACWYVKCKQLNILAFC